MDVRECNDLSPGEAAVKYARAGWHVLPLWWPNADGTCACGLEGCPNVGKHPLGALVPRGHLQATADVTWVQDWWRQYPHANVGIACSASGFLALDVDSGKVLPEDWPDFASTGRTPPRTLVQRSGRADPAYHVLYSVKHLPPHARIRGKVHAPGAPGVDKTLIRHNGLIVVAPSRHKSGQKYRWLNSERPADPGPIMTPRLVYTPNDQATGGEANGANGVDPGAVRNVTSFTDLVQAAVGRTEEGESRAETGHWLACQLRDNNCARADAERIFLPVFYRETMALRPDPPDADIVRRWTQNAWSAPARAPLPGFDPQVREIMDRGAQTATRATAPRPAPERTEVPPEVAQNGAGDHSAAQETVTVAVPAAAPTEAPPPVATDENGPPPEPPPLDPGGPGLLQVDEALFDEARHPVNATDLGNARRFVRMFTGRALFVSDVGRWYVWDGNRWKPDVENTVLRLAAQVVDNIRETALLTDDPEERGRWNAWAHNTESVGRQTALLALAEPRMSTTAEVFDRDPWLLIVQNGTLDLRTGTLRESRPEELCSRQAAVDFDPTATCPRWRSHVRFVSNSDLELASYLRRAIGYTITGLVSERAFFFLTGDGSNGKNVFIEPVMQLLGDYGKTASSALLEGGNEQHPTIIADLLGARLVFVDETREGKRLNAERIKTLTGSKRIKARQMRQDFFEFVPAFKLWITGNGRPAVRDPSDGAWKRLHEVPCRGKVGRDVQLIKDYGDLLYAEEASGILNWAIEGLMDWRQCGLLKPASVQAEIDAHRDEEDYIGQFIDECLEVTGSSEYYLPVPAIYDEYARWAKSQQLRGENFLTKIVFGRRFAKKLDATPVIKKVNNVSTRVMYGVTWSGGASIEARIMTGQATSYEHNE